MTDGRSCISQCDETKKSEGDSTDVVDGFEDRDTEDFHPEYEEDPRGVQPPSKRARDTDSSEKEHK